MNGKRRERDVQGVDTFEKVKQGGRGTYRYKDSVDILNQSRKHDQSRQTAERAVPTIIFSCAPNKVAGLREKKPNPVDVQRNIM
eukprot:3917422-Heterocapsa_arctica.AAC.1